MGRLSRRRGVISVFLLIIFMVTYVFMGMLVDAGRYRIAQTYMESALDNASSSVLSNYNQLIFDLYGLFSVDMELEDGQTVEDAIQEKYEHYLEETLGIAKVNTEKYHTMLSTLIFGEETATYTTDSLYDFEVTELQAGSAITLADTANVEQQLIEYMKFRAPVELTKEMEGFLGKLQAIVDMKERVKESLKKEEIKQKYESNQNGNLPLSDQAANLLKDINEFAEYLYHYTIESHKSLAQLQTQSLPTQADIYNHNPYRIMTYVNTFDQALVQAENIYRAAVQEENRLYQYNLYSLLSNLKGDLERLKGKLEGPKEELEKESKELEKELKELKNKLNKQLKNYEEAVEEEEDEDTLQSLETKIATLETDIATLETDIVTLEIRIRTIEPQITKIEDIQNQIRGVNSNCSIEQLEDYGEVIRTQRRDLNDSFIDIDSILKSFLSGYDSEIQRHDNRISELKIPFNTALDNAKQALRDTLVIVENNAYGLYNMVAGNNGLVQRIYNTVSRYESYVKELENEKTKSQSSATVYDPEIELAQANMGELLKNLDLLANSRTYLDDIGNGMKDSQGQRKKLSVALENVAEVIVNQWKQNAGANNKTTPLQTEMNLSGDNYQNASQAVTLYKQGYDSASIPYLANSINFVSKAFPETQEAICVLYSHVSYFHTGHYRRDPDVIVAEENKVWEKSVSSKDAAEKLNSEQTTKETEEKDGPELDSEKIKENPELLKVNYSYTEDVGFGEIDTEVSVEGKVNTGTLTTILNAGLNLIEKIGDLLEGARDNLYIDAYILSTFPNYKEHYKDYEKNKESWILSEPRGNYLASYAEVEFIITGAGANGRTAVAEKVFEDGADGFGQLSVNSMRLKLFGTRMLFNSLAMLTDSAKLQQASVLSSWAGPFAPLVSAVLVICWIIAETVMDVMILMGDAPDGLDDDGKIPLFKQSKDWLFSLNGVLESAATALVDGIAEQILSKATALTDSVQEKANVMIYQAYTAVDKGIATADGAIDSALETGKTALSEWSSALDSNLDEMAQIPNLDKTGLSETQSLANNLGNLSTDLDSIANEKNQLVDTARTVATNTKEQAVLTVSRMSDTIMEKTESYVEQAGNKAKEFIGKNVSKVVPVGTVVSGGKSDGSMDMSYRDYLYFFLFIMKQETKVQRIQAVIQANINLQNDGNPVLLEQSPVSVWADLETTMKYMFMSNSIVPESWKKDGRMRVKVISAQSY